MNAAGNNTVSMAGGRAGLPDQRRVPMKRITTAASCAAGAVLGADLISAPAAIAGPGSGGGVESGSL